MAIKKMTGNYYRRILKIILQDPRKIKAMLRLRTGGEHRRGRYYERGDGFSAPPITVSVRPSYRCNLRCIQCGQWGLSGIFKDVDAEDLTKEELTSEEIKEFIKEISVFRPYIYFTGGEPLLAEDIFGLIKFASSYHMITGMSSNCTLLSDKAEQLVDSGLDYLYASMDAPGPLNNDIRVGTDSFQKAVEGIKRLVAIRDKKGRGSPFVQVQTIIVKENQDRLHEMARFLDKEMKPDVWGLQLCVFTTHGLNRQTEDIYNREFGVKAVYWKGFTMDFSSGLDCGLLEQEFKKILDTRWGFRLRLYRPLNFSNFSFTEYFKEPQRFLTTPVCMYPWTFAQLQPNGDIAFCGSQPDYIAGNIRKNKFMDIWNGERARAFRKFIRKNLFPTCSRCFGLYNFSHYK